MEHIREKTNRSISEAENKLTSTRKSASIASNAAKSDLQKMKQESDNLSNQVGAQFSAHLITKQGSRLGYHLGFSTQ